MAIAGLAPREKRLIAIMFTIMMSMVIILIYKDITAKHQRSVTQLAQARDTLNSTQLYRGAILSEREGNRIIQAKLSARSPGFDLYTLTNQFIKQGKLSGRADLQSIGMPSREAAFEAVQITLRHVNMQEILDLLHKMYNSQNLITMQKMSRLAPMRDGKGLECSIVMIAPKR